MALGLTNGQKVFATRFSEDTGLNKYVVVAWLYAEENGSAATAREKAGNHNWLNIGYTGSGEKGTGNSFWNNPLTAADVSAKWLTGNYAIPGFGLASAGIRRIAKTASMSPSAQIQAIQQSGWASSHYPSLPSIYTQASGTKLPVDLTAPLPKPLITIPGLSGGGIPGVIGGGTSLNPLSGLAGLAMKAVYAFAVFGGLLLLLLGLALVGADIGLEKLSEPKPVRATRRGLASAGIKNRTNKANESGFKEGFDTGQSVAEEKARTKAQKKEAKRQEKYSQSDKIPF